MATATPTTTHTIALAFEDGVTRFITCAEGQTIADAAYRSRINIPLDCRDGACGTCKAQCESGEYHGGTYIDDALTPDEAVQGFCLPCSMSPKSDLVLQIASTSAVAKTEAATHTAQVAALDRLSPTTMALTLEAPARGQLTFLPGQYVNIAVPGTDQHRSYSFANGPEEEQLRFLIKLTTDGVMSRYLTDRAAVGDEVSFTGPNGSFFLRESERPLLLLAGGTGLAPILSIMRRLRSTGSRRRAHLLYGVSTDADVVEIDTIEHLTADIGTLTWDYCVSDAATSGPNRGYVTSLIEPGHLNGGDVAVYLCGPPAMVDAVRAHLSSQGMEPTGFYYEKFALARTTDPVKPTPAAPEPAPEPTARLMTSPTQTTAKAQPPAPASLGRSIRLAPEDVSKARMIMGQKVARAGSDEPVIPLDPDVDLILTSDARSIAGQLVLPPADIVPVTTAPTAAEVRGAGGYVIGEEHPSVRHSDAIFDARKALELGALELTIGRLSSGQLAGYRLLAESTLPHVVGERFADAAAYTETNAAFHHYLFTLTGNEHLLEAYQALGVKGAMDEALRNATWCHPRVATDHLELVSAFEAEDREAARALITDHAARSKLTMRRAMDEIDTRNRPAFFSPGRFTGSIVLITGAAQGIGETTARRLSAEGATVVLADRSALVRDLASQLASGGLATHVVIADLETWDGAQSVVSDALTRFGRIDVAIHTVGGTIWAKPFHHYSPDQIQAEIGRSLFPTLWGCRAVLPTMIEQGGGTIVNVSSVATRGINRVPYAAAKGGINAITHALALEAAPYGVRVVATAPGGTNAPERRIPRGPAAETEQEQEWYQAIIDQTVDSSSMKRYGSLDEQAAAIVFLASREASYITGTILPVAGGDQG